MAKAKTKSKATASSKESREEVKEAVKSTSPLADLYERWNELAERDVSTSEALFSVIKQLAEFSRDQYHYSPIPLPAAAEKKVMGLLSSVIEDEKSKEFEWRRKTIRQFKFYLSNQAKYGSLIDQSASQGWMDALCDLKDEVAAQGTKKMCLTCYPPETASSIMASAKQACRALWKIKQLSALRNPVSEEQLQPLSIKLGDAKKYRKDWQPIHFAEYQNALLCESIRLSDYAKRIGVSICDQATGIIKIKNRTFLIKKSSTLAWTVIRLLMTAKDGKALLFKGWFGCFGGADKNKTSFRKLIRPINSADPTHNKKVFKLHQPPQRQGSDINE